MKSQGRVTVARRSSGSDYTAFHARAWQVSSTGLTFIIQHFPKGSSNAKGIPLGRSPWDLRGKISLCLLLFFSTLFAQAQTTSTITGKVTDTKGNSLNSVNISLTQRDASAKGTSKGAATNAKGSFRIENLSPGTYTLNITAVGYHSQNVTIAVVAGQTLAVPVVQLKSQSQELDEVVVNADKNRYLEVLPSPSLRLNTKLVEVPQNIQIVSEELIREQIAFDIFEGISRNTSGVRRAMHQAYPLIYMRGFSIDGMRNGMNNRGYQGPMRDDMSFVDRIEFVKGPTGFMMGNTSLGGLYNVVTKKPTGSGKKVRHSHSAVLIPIV